MANSNHIAKKNKLIKLKLVMKNLQSCLSLWKRLPIYISYDILSSRITTLPSIMSDVEELQDQHDHEEASSCHFGDSKAVVPPQDVVKEGHFAVVAVDGVETKRFMVPLSYLTHPMFLVLLEKAAEEYGFDHEGALTIPCTPTEIDNILAERWNGATAANSRRRANHCRRNYSNFVLLIYYLRFQKIFTVTICTDSNAIFNY
ncbi:protein SMALL AUXIN UP-REGULATED RNA 54-like [Spinacia oleracea]|uniref:Protein SMALL AUXIN UP-REGULATED RNA 54-like n=1 Tax=Spinacia oleracea TaxID=3562 RepID=A0A9R0HXN4_SPIOL|nr:protein SMALL AUXIN UP-REGULATED RNA 54-like [Spinacia oleracea]